MVDVMLDLGLITVVGMMVWRGAFLRAAVVPLVRLRDELRNEWGQGRSKAPAWLGGIVLRLEEFRDFRRSLIVAGLRDSPTEWLLRTLGFAVMVVAGCAVLDGILYTSQRDLLVPIWASLVLAALVFPLRALRLVQRVRARRFEAGHSLGAMFKLFRVMGRRPIRHHASLDPGDPLLVLARCRRSPVLLQMLTDPRWLSLVPPPTTTWEWFEGFGQAYGVEEAQEHATALRNASEGSEGAQADEYGRQAQSWSAKWRGNVSSLFASRGVRRLMPLTLLLLPMLIIIFSSVIASWAT